MKSDATAIRDVASLFKRTLATFIHCWSLLVVILPSQLAIAGEPSDPPLAETLAFIATKVDNSGAANYKDGVGGKLTYVYRIQFTGSQFIVTEIFENNSKVPDDRSREKKVTQGDLKDLAPKLCRIGGGSQGAYQLDLFNRDGTNAMLQVYNDGGPQKTKVCSLSLQGEDTATKLLKAFRHAAYLCGVKDDLF
ncbi:MAG: hypothetical protein ACAI37_06475 [Chthoniobacter sp.]